MKEQLGWWWWGEEEKDDNDEEEETEAEDKKDKNLIYIIYLAAICTFLISPIRQRSDNYAFVLVLLLHQTPQTKAGRVNPMF